MFKNFLNKVKENEEKLKNRANVLFDKTKEKKNTNKTTNKYSSKGLGIDTDNELSILNDKKFWGTNEREKSTSKPQTAKANKEQPPKKEEKDYSKVADLMYPTMKKKEGDSLQKTKKEEETPIDKLIQKENKNADKDIKKIIEIEREATKNMKSDFDNVNFSENALKKARKFIADSEGYRENAYQDTRGVWTIGYGHTKNVKQGDKITKEDAEKIFKEDLEEHIIPLKKVKVPLNDNQKAALASLIYNIGGTNFSNSSILKKLNEGDIEGAAEAFELYCKETKTVNINGKNVRKKFTNQGLLNRRRKEKELFLTPTD